MNIPNIGTKQEIPEEAKGNPVYEQTRQDMPLWCCGRNCGRNTRIVCAILAFVGIGCGIFACLSPKFFSYVALRNDTFYDPETIDPDPKKALPSPFEYATEANVGLFKYQILDVFEFPWPPKRERALADEMLLKELRRLQNGGATNPPSASPSNAPTNPKTPSPTAAPSNAPTAKPTRSPTAYPTVNLDDCAGVDSLNPGPGSVACGVTPSPTTTPSAAPTITNRNDIVAETVQIGVVLSYEKGIGQFDSTFSNAQRGGILGPVFALVATLFSLSELFFCTYKCSWLPGALFMYLAFMFQLFTLFLFLSETWCKYDQECSLGSAGYLSVIAVICFMIAQNLLCCSPRPAPYFNMCKKKNPKRKKKKKGSPGDESENDGLTRDPVDPDSGAPDNFRDDDDRGDYDSPYADRNDNDLYSSSGYGDDSYYTDDNGHGDYYTEDDYDNSDNRQRY